jgi:hypothetical protein
MKPKNTHIAQRKYNKRKKLLDNNIEPVFDDEGDDDLLFNNFDDRYEPIIHDDEDEDNTEDDDIIEDADGNIVENHDDDDIDDEKVKKIKDVVLEEDKPKKRGRKTAGDKAKFYVQPAEFDQEIMNYYDSGKMSDTLALMISKISHKLSYAPNFINYSYREEMVGDGVIRMMKALIAKKYNREKGTNPFSYFTRIAFNAFRNRIKKEKHVHETHEKYSRELMFMSECAGNLHKNNNISIMKERMRDYD